MTGGSDGRPQERAECRVFNSDDSSLIVEFYWNAVQEADCVRILMPGDTYLEIDELATDGHPLPYNERFADKWDMYQTARSQTEGQTDIGAVAWMDEASRQALRAAHVNTVEQLATIGDDQVSRIGFGFVRFRDKARAEVETRQKAAEYEPP